MVADIAQVDTIITVRDYARDHVSLQALPLAALAQAAAAVCQPRGHAGADRRAARARDGRQVELSRAETCWKTRAAAATPTAASPACASPPPRATSG